MKRSVKKQTGRWLQLPLLMLMLLLSAATHAQVTISGKVTAADNSAVSDVSVVVRNTNFGTTTDANGDYSINANLKPGRYILEFSAVGLKTKTAEVNVANGTNTYSVNVVLSDDVLGLDEVVVTGTSQGTTKKQLGSYVSTVKGDQLTKGATGNVLAALQGKTAGAQIIQNSGDPAGGISVRLRGISSINSSSEPLYIVDGIIVNNATTRVTNTSGNYDGQNFVGNIGQNRLSDINPADIERIEVLRGPATLLYGSGAIGGVVNVVDNRIPRQLRAPQTIVDSRFNSVSDETSLALTHDGSADQLAWHFDGFDRQSNDHDVPTFTNDEGETASKLANTIKPRKKPCNCTNLQTFLAKEIL